MYLKEIRRGTLRVLTSPLPSKCFTGSKDASFFNMEEALAGEVAVSASSTYGDLETTEEVAVEK